MDPVGISLGAASLLFQVFSGCVQAYQLFTEAGNFEKDYQFLRIRFKTEQYRLLDFASVVKLTEQDETLIINSSNRGILLEILDQQSKMLIRFGRLDERLRPLAQPLVEPAQADSDLGGNDDNESLTRRFPHADSLLQRALTFAENTTKYPSKLRWVVFDRTKVEELLSRLVASNNFLRELLTSHELQMLRQQELQTGYQILQLNTRLDQISEIVQAGLILVKDTVDRQGSMGRLEGYRSQGQTSPEGSGAGQEVGLVSSLAELGQVKALVVAAEKGEEEGGWSRHLMSLSLEHEETALQLDPKDIILDDLDDNTNLSGRRSAGWHHPPDGPRTRIWIEWKHIDPHHIYNPADGPDPNTLRRFRALVTLLRQHSHIRQFLAPPCLGYYIHTPSPPSCPSLNYGIVFHPPSSPGIDPLTAPTSLRSLLQNPSFLPSLNARLSLMRTLAQAVQRLHAVNWLNKGLCSENIIFFLPPYTSIPDDSSMLAEPYLTGFTFSRPSSSPSLSSAPPQTNAEDLYRHPGVQGSPREGTKSLGFRKRHDVYSLGVVLTEIVHWKCIEEILEIERKEKISVKDVIAARGKLLSKENLEKMKFLVGGKATGAIEACLVGMRGLGMEEGESEEGGEGGVRFAKGFGGWVVAPLEG